MTVSNVYKFYGVDDITSTAAQTMFGTSVVEGVTKQNPLVNETYIIKSLLVTSAGTPTVTVANNDITTIKTAALTANTTTELLTQPLIIEGDTAFKITSSTTDSFDIAISYLNIKKDRID
jgi:hypothetical protein|tara:strand:+ start:732 stop:1091 length:360 start_codon:yes stop_codon:yes gene_type:complete